MRAKDPLLKNLEIRRRPWELASFVLVKVKCYMVTLWVR